MRKKFLAMATILSFGMVNAPAPDFNICEAAEVENVAQVYNLNFDISKGVEKSLTYNGKTIYFMAYENIVYVRTPKNADAQKLSIYIPAAYLHGGMINGYAARTAPIFVPNGVGGYFPGEIQPPSENDRMTHGANTALAALSRGYVVVSPAIRGRTTVTDGEYVGKAPALIVDYKAVVRYLRYNKNSLPAGHIEKIISNGTSAGGALSLALATTGNAPEFEPYLKEIGAADESDDIFAASVYCPITNLENADMAYEWIFGDEKKYYQAMWQKRGAHGTAENANNPTQSANVQTMTKDEIAVSKILRDAFPDYVNSLNLRDEQGNILTLDKKGNGTFKDYIKRKYIESAQDALDKGENLLNVSWLKIKNGKVVDVDLKKYAAVATRQKAAPAFDKMDLSSAENDEFGTEKNSPRHFTEIIGKNYGGETAESKIIKIMNPMNFIGRADVTLAEHFRIRHGAIDRDTSLAIPAITALKLQNNGADVDFRSVWGVGHKGDYDLDEMFDWIDSICK